MKSYKLIYRMKNLTSLLSYLLLFMLVSSTGKAQLLAQGCINFNNLTPDVTYTTAGYEDAAVIQAETDVYELRLYEYNDRFNPTPFTGLTPETATDYEADTLAAHLEGAYLRLSFDAAVNAISFDYENNGGAMLLGGNYRTGQNRPKFITYDDFEATFEGVTTEISAGVFVYVDNGHVEITTDHAITDFRFGGQDITIDNICFDKVAVTEPGCHAFFFTEMDGPKPIIGGEYIKNGTQAGVNWTANGADLPGSSIVRPNFTATDVGTYTICYEVSVDDGACIDTYCDDIEITDLDANCTDFVELEVGSIYNEADTTMDIPVAFENDIGIGFNGLKQETGATVFGNAFVLDDDKLYLDNMMLLLDYSYNLQQVSAVTLTCEGAITAVQVNGAATQFYEDGLVNPSSDVYTYTFDLNDLPVDETFETLLFGGENLTIHSVCFEELEPACEANFEIEIIEEPTFYTVNITSTSTSDSEITEYRWFLNDVFLSQFLMTQSSISFTVESLETMDMGLTIESAGGCYDSYFQLLGLEVLEVWPGDANNDGVANNFDLLNLGITFGSTGFERFGTSTNWQAYQVDAWAEVTADLVNYAHSDCNGNGTVGNEDVAALALNYGLTTGKTEWTTEGTEDDAPFYVDLPEDELLEGAFFEAPIILGSEDIPVNEIYGLAFSVNYDPAILEETSLEVIFDDSWLGAEESEIITIYKVFPEEGRIEIAISRIDQTDITGFGRIASIGGIIDNIAGKDEALVEWNFSISNVRAINANEAEVFVYPLGTQTNVNLLDEDETDFLNLQIAPNPASDWLTIKVPQLQEATTINIFNLQGKLIDSLSPTNTTETIDIATYQNGLYFVQVKYTDKIQSQKFQVLR